MEKFTVTKMQNLTVIKMEKNDNDKYGKNIW